MRGRTLLVLAAVLVADCRPARERPATLVLAMDQDVLGVDPHRHDDNVTSSVLGNVYDPLVTFDEEMRIVPALAASWSNPGDLVWRFRLRPGVTFHDGRPLTSADVKHSLERALRMRTAHYLRAVSRVDAPDPSTVELRTEVPQPVLLNKLALIAVVPDGTPDELVRPVGTGAYRVASWEPGKGLALEANERYWGRRPRIRRAYFRTLPDPVERARALARGEIHLAREVSRGALPPGTKGVAFVSQPGLAVLYLGVSFRVDGPLRRAEVRQAIFWALDPRELIARAGIEAVPIDQLVPASVFGFLPGREAGRPQLDRARTLLAAAGLRDGFDVTLEMARSNAATLGAILPEQLGRVGIRTRVEALDWPLLSARLERQESPFFCVGWGCYGDASDLFDAMLHTRDGARYGASNFGAFSSPRLDAAVERAGAVLQPALRLVELHRAMRTSLEELPLIPVYNRKRSYGLDDRLLFRPRQNGQVLVADLDWADR